MKDFSIIWLLLYTKTGRVILGLLVTYLVFYVAISMLGWWTVPVISALIGAFLLYIYYDMKPKKPKQKKKTKEENHHNGYKTELVVGIGLLVFAALFSLGILLYDYWDELRYREPFYEETPNEVEEVVLPDTSTYVPDTIGVFENEKPKAKSGKSKSVKSASSSSHHSSSYDNMRGFDPASEDDTEDNGLSRYMENNDNDGRN